MSLGPGSECRSAGPTGPPQQSRPSDRGEQTPSPTTLENSTPTVPRSSDVTHRPHHPDRAPRATPRTAGNDVARRTAAPRKSWAVLAVALTAQILVVLDISVVNTALPTIGSALHLDSSDLQWLVTAYLMMSGGGLLLGGRIADLLSRRRVFLTGMAVFTIASLVSGFAGNAGELIAARATQGLAAALMTPAALSLIMTTYSGAQRKTGLALWGAVGSLGVAAGVLVGGALTTWAGWQAIFWVNVPIGVVALLVGRRVLAKDTHAAARPEQFDLPGAVTVVGGLGALMSPSPAPPATAGRRPTPGRARRLGGAARRVPPLERRAASPLVPPHTWKVRTLVSGTTVMLGVTGLLVGAVFLTSIFVQTVLGYSALRAGLAFLPFALAITAGTCSPGTCWATSRRATSPPAGCSSPSARRCAVHGARATRTTPPTCCPAWCPRARRRHGVRPRLRHRDGRHPGPARRHGVRVPDDRPRGRRRPRCRRPVRGRQPRAGSLTTAAGVVDGVLRRVPRRSRHRRRGRGRRLLRMPATRARRRRRMHMH